MKRRLTTILIVLSVAGLTGLTVVQILWLRNAIKVNEQRFDIAVKEALYEISSGIQEFEYEPFVRELISRNTQDLDENSATSATIESRFDNQQEGGQKLYVHIADQLDTTITIDMESDLQRNYDQSGELADIQTWSLDFGIGELPVSVMVDPSEFAEKFAAQRKAVDELIIKQMFSLQPITELLDTAKLREIIADALANKGISTHFEFGITEYTPNNFVFVSEGSSLQQLYTSEYVVDLMPRSFFESTKRLMLVFPDRTAYLLRAVWFPLGLSGLFLLLVMTSFALALYIIFRQKQLSAMKTDFINNMTHELKTPIATISLASEMLKDDTISCQAENRLKYAGVIFEENKRLGNQVEKVLHMARMEKGEVKYSLEPVNIHDIIEVVARQFELQMEDSGGQLRVSLDAARSMVSADELHITNMLNNLLDNALKYNDKESPDIELSTRNSGNHLLIRVRDNGIGMHKEELKRIFDNFYRVNKGDVHDTKGFGIGLSYVKTIVQAHRGTIGVQSQLDKGTSFTIKIPLLNV